MGRIAVWISLRRSDLA